MLMRRETKRIVQLLADGILSAICYTALAAAALNPMHIASVLTPVALPVIAGVLNALTFRCRTIERGFGAGFAIIITAYLFPLIMLRAAVRGK